jgi:hypothetical protein
MVQSLSQPQAHARRPKIEKEISAAEGVANLLTARIHWLNTNKSSSAVKRRAAFANRWAGLARIWPPVSKLGTERQETLGFRQSGRVIPSVCSTISLAWGLLKCRHECACL